jgi:hypothetical protein
MIDSQRDDVDNEADINVYSDEDDVYSQRGRRRQRDYGAVESWEEGFMEGYEDAYNEDESLIEDEGYDDIDYIDEDEVYSRGEVVGKETAESEDT